MKRKLVALLAVVALGVAVVPVAFAASVGVTGKEFKFSLSTKTVKHGKVTFKLTNKGKLKHDFKIAGKKTKLVSPGKSASVTVTLKRGKYSYICTVPGHAAAGMKGSLKVS
ncbi:MAG: plastocyanin/azurin family copper-binding protein [Thermoleophilaceae bacterium]